MKTNKLKKLKKITAVIATANIVTCIACEIAALYCAIRLHNMLDSSLYLSAAIINSAAFWFMSILRDAVISELEDRKIITLREVKTNAKKNQRKNVKGA